MKKNNLKIKNNTNIIQKIINIYFSIFPEIVMHNHTYRLKKFVKEVSDKYDNKGKTIIDIGAGNCPYRTLFKKAKYFSHDINNNQNRSIDYIGEINILPIEKFDYILCTQVLEHLKDPDSTFKNFERILKPGGKLFLTTHMAFQEHFIPTDYFRFTRYGLKYLAEKNGLKVEKIQPQGGRFIVLSKELQILVPSLVKNKYAIIIYYLLFSIPIFIINFILYLLDFLDKDKTLTLNYECIFTK